MIMTLTLPTIQLMPFWIDNVEAWFCHAEADFHEHVITDPRVQLLAVVKALLHYFSRRFTTSTFTSDVLEPYETLKRSILKL